MMILDSYNECDITARIDEENMLNKDILIEIIDEIRKVLFPGFFDNNKVRSEYLKFLVGERTGIYTVSFEETGVKRV